MSGTIEAIEAQVKDARKELNNAIDHLMLQQQQLHAQQAVVGKAWSEVHSAANRLEQLALRK